MKILFVSRGDACRSVIAAGLARQIFGTQVTIDTAGIKLRPLHPVAVDVMAEINIDVSSHEPSELDMLQITGYDLLVVVEPRNPFTGQDVKTQYQHWPLPDPLDPPVSDKEIVQRIKDTRIALSKHIKHLGQQIEMKLRGGTSR